MDKKSNGLTILETFTINVSAVDDPPSIKNTLSDLTANEDAPYSQIDLNEVFTDCDNYDNEITKTLLENSRPDLVTATISENILKLEYQQNQSGIATIIIRRTSNGKTVDEILTLTVTAVDDPPVINQEMIHFSLHFSSQSWIIFQHESISNNVLLFFSLQLSSHIIFFLRGFNFEYKTYY
ncbi:hypothetical protein MHK_002718 [Candidatus Magnetomorum sp. HK-1]|nr:hypothetical protein MHK_002718 [Candidatus Magnetomorum sp. HK-1]